MSESLKFIPGLLVPPRRATLNRLKDLHDELMRYEQIPIATEHLLHGGMYVRTIRLEPETVMEGSLIKLATVLIVNGCASMVAGDDVVELQGYNVLAGCAGRKQVFVTRTAVEMTMIFPTSAKTVADAEDEVFAEAHLLMSRADGSRDKVTITGE